MKIRTWRVSLPFSRGHRFKYMFSSGFDAGVEASDGRQGAPVLPTKDVVVTHTGRYSQDIPAIVDNAARIHKLSLRSIVVVRNEGSLPYIEFKASSSRELPMMNSSIYLHIGRYEFIGGISDRFTAGFNLTPEEFAKLKDFRELSRERVTRRGNSFGLCCFSPVPDNGYLSDSLFSICTARAANLSAKTCIKESASQSFFFRPGQRGLYSFCVSPAHGPTTPRRSP